MGKRERYRAGRKRLERERSEACACVLLLVHYPDYGTITARTSYVVTAKAKAKAKGKAKSKSKLRAGVRQPQLGLNHSLNHSTIHFSLNRTWFLPVFQRSDASLEAPCTSLQMLHSSRVLVHNAFIQ